MYFILRTSKFYLYMLHVLPWKVHVHATHVCMLYMYVVYDVHVNVLSVHVYGTRVHVCNHVPSYYLYVYVVHTTYKCTVVFACTLYNYLCTTHTTTKDSLQLTLQQQSIFRQLQQWACIFKLYVLFVTV